MRVWFKKTEYTQREEYMHTHVDMVQIQIYYLYSKSKYISSW